MHKINRYPDGTSYAEIIGPHENLFPEFVFRINSYEDLWHLNQIVDAYKHNNFKPTVIIPNLLDAQADRRFSGTQSSGLKLVCDFLNSMDAKFKIFHPHNPEVIEGLIKNVEIIDNSKFISMVLEQIVTDKFGIEWDRLQRDSILSNITLMSSDAGGFKPLMKLCDKINWRGETFSAAKARSWDEKDGTKFVQQIDREAFQGKDILIIDDICVKGGTFIGLAKLLRKRNIGKLYLAVSHLTVPNPNPELFELFDKIFTTNSKFDEYYPLPAKHGNFGLDRAKNLKVIKMFNIN